MKRKKYGIGIDTLINDAPVETAGAITNLIPVLANAIKTITSAGVDQYPITQTQGIKSFGMGGNVSGVPVNVEGGETIKTPDGMTGELIGNSHDSGGINMSLPKGTTIYSDRLKVGGKTLADRQKARVAREERLNKLLVDNTQDAILKSTLQRVQAQNRTEDEKDKQVMAFANQLQDQLDTIDSFMMDGVVGDKKSYANGTPYVDFYGNDDELYQFNRDNNKYFKRTLDGENFKWSEFNPDASFINDHLDIQNNSGVPQGALGKLQGLIGTDGTTSMIPKSTLKGYREHSDSIVPSTLPSLANITATDATGAKQNAQDVMMNSLQLGNIDNKLPTVDMMLNNSDVITEVNESTLGDKLGLASSMFSGIAPLVTTLANRAGDKGNTNFFKNVGNRSLSTLEDTESSLNAQKEIALRENRILANTANQSNRNNATGVNTVRALDTATSVGTANNNAKIVQDFLSSISNISGQKAGIQMQADGQNAQAETQREIYDKQDRDNFSTQLGRNLNNIGTIGQSQAKILNEKKLADDQVDLLSQLSTHGLKIKRVGGRLTVTN